VATTGTWFKSSLSFANGNCVEVLIEEDGNGVQVRNSRDHGQGTLHFTREEWIALLSGVKAGEFELPDAG
jgi:Domain of unknown function (DUF397)